MVFHFSQSLDSPRFALLVKCTVSCENHCWKWQTYTGIFGTISDRVTHQPVEGVEVFVTACSSRYPQCDPTSDDFSLNRLSAITTKYGPVLRIIEKIFRKILSMEKSLLQSLLPRSSTQRDMHNDTGKSRSGFGMITKLWLSSDIDIFVVLTSFCFDMASIEQRSLSIFHHAEAWVT